MINDSGTRREIDDGGERIVYGDHGAMREPTTGKGRYDLLSPFALKRLARWYELGAQKYAPRNWEKGIPFSRCIDSAKRHIDKFLMNLHDEDHLAAAVWNLSAIMHYQDAGPEGYDDLPKYGQRQAAPSAATEKPATAATRNYRIVAVDFDGTLCRNAWPEIGEANVGLIDRLLQRQKSGDKLILWTCREHEALAEAVAWCAERELRFDAVNANLPEMNALYGNDSRKIGADEYIDDKNLLVDIVTQEAFDFFNKAPGPDSIRPGMRKEEE